MFTALEVEMLPICRCVLTTLTLGLKPQEWNFLIERSEDDLQFSGLPQSEVLREQRKNFVTMAYGGEDQFALGISRYSADASKVSSLIGKNLRSLLKKHSHANLKTVCGNIVRNHFWAEGALK
jgi:hypothetical protein